MSPLWGQQGVTIGFTLWLWGDVKAQLPEVPEVLWVLWITFSPRENMLSMVLIPNGLWLSVLLAWKIQASPNFTKENVHGRHPEQGNWGVRPSHFFFYLKFEFLVKFAILITEEHQVETNRGFTKEVMAVDRTWRFISQEWYFSPPGRMQRQERGSEDPVLRDTSASHWTEELPVDVMPDASSLKRTERSWWALKSTHRADEGKRRHPILLATKG